MIRIISGPINSGKTSWLCKDYTSRIDADGFVCKKVFVADLHIGYDLQHLATGNCLPFIRKTTHLPENWIEAARIGKMYSFCTAGFQFAAEIAEKALINQISCFYIDEIGPLELSGNGFCKIMRQLISSDIDVVVAVRETLVHDVIQFFAISGPEIIILPA